ncbi:MAG: hypothetical protein JRH08_15360 [Deltaproteobacteria bacterium]|nr:hypothetical protein [Deltaproteobacteria bacterium]MBW1927741.1 hypothetical protein [Deltaproteobacteria bacterium]MBW2127008.1 hypothetical protein [Deltaproteobacteria bacterium]
MRNNKLKRSLSQFLQSPPNLVLAQTLPVALLRPYIHALGFAYYLVRRKERKETSSTIISRVTNGSNQIQKYSLLYNTYRSIFEHYLEKIIIATRSPSEMAEYLIRHCEIGDTRWLDLVEVAGRGGILATGHFGASEFIPVLLAVNGYKVAAVTVYKSDRLREIARRRAEYYNIWLIDAGQTRSSFLDFRKAIGNGRILVVAFDEIEHWVPTRNCWIRVLGDICPADRGLDVLQRRTGAPACLGLLRRTPRGSAKKYRLSLHPLSRSEEGRSISASGWEILESYIRNYPEQWYKWNSIARDLANYRLKETPRNSNA